LTIKCVPNAIFNPTISEPSKFMLPPEEKRKLVEITAVDYNSAVSLSITVSGTQKNAEEAFLKTGEAVRKPELC